jgi:hypothetical protein
MRASVGGEGQQWAAGVPETFTTFKFIKFINFAIFDPTQHVPSMAPRQAPCPTRGGTHLLDATSPSPSVLGEGVEGEG